MGKRAKDIMTSDVIVAKKDSRIQDIAKILLENRIGGVPVVDEDNKVIGIISETDIIKKESNIDTPTIITLLQGVIYFPDLKKVEKEILEVASYKVEDLMSTNVTKVNEEDSFEDVANLMIKKSINRVPVVDLNNKLKGIICRYDIIKSMYSE
jgi:CBS domain-containing protein